MKTIEIDKIIAFFHDHQTYLIIFSITVLIITVILIYFNKSKQTSSNDNKLLQYFNNDYNTDDREKLIKNETENNNLDQMSFKKREELKNKMYQIGSNYCRASSTLEFIPNEDSNFTKENQNKYFYYANCNNIDIEQGTKEIKKSIISLVLLDEKDKLMQNYNKEAFKQDIINTLNSINHRNIKKTFHFDILTKQKIYIKIQKYEKYGSLKDFIIKMKVSS